MLRSGIMRKLFVLALLGLMVASLVGWYVTRDTLPRQIVIAAGEEGGLYHDFALELARSLEHNTGVRAVVQATSGSGANRQLMESSALRKPDLAILQADFVSATSMDVVAPLYPEMVYVIVRRDSQAESIGDLAGMRIALGSDGTGMRQTASQILAHYGIGVDSLSSSDSYFTALADPESDLEGAIVTAGLGNRDVSRLLGTNRFRLLPVTDAEAIQMKEPFLRYDEIPRGLFSEGPAVPSESIATLATAAVLVARKGSPTALIRAALTAVYEADLALEFPALIPPAEAADWIPFRLHPASRSYYNPADRIGLLASVMESLAATKELLFALGAGGYLIWMRWRRTRKNERQRLIQSQKDHLDTLLEQTLSIEREQMMTTDPVRLREYLDQVTRIKLRALHQFTEEELRGDQSFSIFLMQCSSLISRLQLNILVGSNGG